MKLTRSLIATPMLIYIIKTFIKIQNRVNHDNTILKQLHIKCIAFLSKLFKLVSILGIPDKIYGKPNKPIS